MMDLTLGISPCPNDTYIFGALVTGQLAMPQDIPAVQLHMADVEELNAMARRGVLDVTKLSVAAVADVLDTYVLLHAGGALGRGCGPVLVAAAPYTAEELHNASIAIPGRLTTANLLLSLHGAFGGERVEMVFDQVMPAVASGRCKAGVLIHEGRFTFAGHGLHKVLDLGAWWEEFSGAPIPLGVIAAKRSLGSEKIARINRLIHASLAFANTHPASVRGFIQQHAQEMAEEIQQRHIATFVNEYSLDLGEEGKDAVLALLTKAAEQAGKSLPSEVPVFMQG